MGVGVGRVKPDAGLTLRGLGSQCSRRRSLPEAFSSSLAPRPGATTFLATATRTWPLVAAAMFLLSETSLGATPLHVFQGITIPLAALAVEGLQLLGWRRSRGRS
jgi:hypothetical protein